MSMNCLKSIVKVAMAEDNIESAVMEKMINLQSSQEIRLCKAQLIETLRTRFSAVWLMVARF